MKKIYFLIVLSVLFVCGCRTPEYYQDQAVQKARTYLLKNSPQLSFEESSYIRFNKPVILHSNIVGGVDSLTSTRIKSNINQVQIAWNIPGNTTFFTVWGVCSSTMRDFTPERIFVREFNPQDLERRIAINKSRSGVAKHLFSLLSVEDYNDLRFRDPEIYNSKFQLDEEIMPKDDFLQFAVVWTLKSNPDTQVVVIGNGKVNLEEFQVVSCSELTRADVEENLLAPYVRPVAEEIPEEPEAEEQTAECLPKEQYFSS